MSTIFHTSKDPSGSKQTSNPIIDFVVHTIGLLLTIPLYIFIYRTLPTIFTPGVFGKIIIFVIVLIVVQFLFHIIKKWVVYISIFWVCLLLIGTVSNDYGFKNVYQDYRDIIFSLMNKPNPVDVLLSAIQPFPNKTAIKNAVDYAHPAVRDFALGAVNTHFTEEQKDEQDRMLIQFLAVFKEINTRWHYVNDPTSREYFAKGSESVKYLSGDCDDHSIFMIACLKAIGAKARFIHTNKHMYPELFIGDLAALNHVNYLIRNTLFPFESAGFDLYYHTDEEGNHWINMDYTGKYPGAKFMDNAVLGVLEL